MSVFRTALTGVALFSLLIRVLQTKFGNDVLLPDIFQDVDVESLQYSSIAVGDISGDDVADFVVCGRTADGNAFTATYVNANGNRYKYPDNSVFIPSLPSVYDCSVVLADFNLDGLDDILLSGYNGSYFISTIYESYSDGHYSPVSGSDFYPSLIGVERSCSAYGDLNGDGRLDFLLFGDNQTIYFSQIYASYHNGSFVAMSSSFFNGNYPIEMDFCGVSVGDLTNDALDDFVASGNYNTYAYLGLPNNTMLLASSAFYDGNAPIGLSYSSIAIGELNGDGLNDIVIFGINSTSELLAFAYFQLTNATQRLAVPSEFDGSLPAGMSRGTASIGDLTNDGRMDLFYTGDSVAFTLYIQQINGTLVQMDSIFQYGETESENYPSSAIFDMNGDGLNDLYVNGQFLSIFQQLPSGILEPFLSSFVTSSLIIGVIYSSSLIDDFNNDGLNDILLCGGTIVGDIFEVYLQNDNITVSVATDSFYNGVLPTPSSFNSISSGDFDSNGLTDFVSMGGESGPLSAELFLQNQNHTMSLAMNSIFLRDLPAQLYQGWSSSGDLNDDGKDDITMMGTNDSSNGRGYFFVQLSNGSMLESTVELFSTDSVPFAFYSTGFVEDMTGDGLNDMFFSGDISVGVSLVFYRQLINNTYGNWTNVYFNGIIPTPFDSGAVGIGDFNSDGLKDMYFTGNYTLGLSCGMFLGLDNGTVYNATSEYSSGLFTAVSVAAIIVGDLDGDSKDDFVVSGFDVSAALTSIYLQNVFNSMVVADPTLFEVSSPQNVYSGSLSIGEFPSDVALLVTGYPYYTGIFLTVFVNKSSTSTSVNSNANSSMSTTSSNQSDTLSAIIGSVIGGTAFLLISAFIVFCSFLVAGCIVCVVCISMVIAVAVFILVIVVVVAILVVALVSGIGMAKWYLGNNKSKLDVDDDVAYEESILDPDHIRDLMSKTNSYRQLRMEELELGRKLGEGAYGAVYAGLWNGTTVAIKVLQLSDINSDGLKEFDSEATLMAKVSHHPNLLRFIGAVVSPDKLCIVSLFCKNGSLDKLLGKEDLGWLIKYRIACDAAAGLSFLHDEGIVHRDIAARNILLDEDYKAYISDLGLARLFDNPEDAVAGSSTKSSVGPVRWMSPEAIRERKYSSSSDAFSFGILLWEIVEDGKLPYPDLSNLVDVALRVVRLDQRPAISGRCGPELTQLMTNLWKTDPASRPSMQQVYDELKFLYRREAEAFEGQ